MTAPSSVWPVLLLGLAPSVAWSQASWPGFQPAADFAEQVRWLRLESGVRAMLNAPLTLRADRRLLVVFATPNGNTLEQTLGCAASSELDWWYDIQHVAAQIRRLRELDATQEIVLAVVQAPELSWPAFRRKRTVVPCPGAPDIANRPLTSTSRSCIPMMPSASLRAADSGARPAPSSRISSTISSAAADR